MAARFEIASAKAGQFNWVLKSQGRTLATGEPYARRAMAEKAIESLRKAAATAGVNDTTVKAPAKAAPTKAAAAKTAKPRKAAANATATTRKATATKKAGSAAKKPAVTRKRAARSG